MVAGHGRWKLPFKAGSVAACSSLACPIMLHRACLYRGTEFRLLAGPQWHVSPCDLGKLALCYQMRNEDRDYCSMWMPEEQMERDVFLFMVLFSSPLSFKKRQNSLTVPLNHPLNHPNVSFWELTRIELGLAWSLFVSSFRVASFWICFFVWSRAVYM